MFCLWMLPGWGWSTRKSRGTRSKGNLSLIIIIIQSTVTVFKEVCYIPRDCVDSEASLVRKAELDPRVNQVLRAAQVRQGTRDLKGSQDLQDLLDHLVLQYVELVPLLLCPEEVTLNDTGYFFSGCSWKRRSKRLPRPSRRECEIFIHIVHCISFLDQPQLFYELLSHTYNLLFDGVIGFARATRTAGITRTSWTSCEWNWRCHH